MTNIIPKIDKRIVVPPRFVYAVHFSDGWVKVGRGASPNARIRQHEAASRMRGATMLSFCASGPLADSRSAEASLLRFCASQGQPAWGREWFTGVDFDALRALIARDYSGDSDEAFFAASAAATEKAESFDEKFSRAFPTPDPEWIHCLAVSYAVRDMLISKGGCGYELNRSEGQASPFENAFALLRYKKSEEDRAEMMIEASVAALEGDIGDYMHSIKSAMKELLADTLGVPSEELP